MSIPQWPLRTQSFHWASWRTASQKRIAAGFARRCDPKPWLHTRRAYWHDRLQLHEQPSRAPH